MNSFLIIVERDSVCMGDDVYAPHEYSFKLPESATLNEVFGHLAKESYLASVAGKNHSWEATISSEAVALFKGNSKTPEPSISLGTQLSKYVYDGRVNVNFKYNSSTT